MSLVIAVDFDGTCVTHEFPKVGREIGAAPVLKALVEKGHKLILFTMRSDIDAPISNDPAIHAEGGDYLSQALRWFEKWDIPLYGIQSNPTQREWTTSPKAYAQLYIDDAALGCPLTSDELDTRPYVNWEAVAAMLRWNEVL